MIKEVFILQVGLTLVLIAFVIWKHLKRLNIEISNVLYAIPTLLLLIGAVIAGSSIVFIVSAYADTLPSIKEVLKQ